MLGDLKTNHEGTAWHRRGKSMIPEIQPMRQYSALPAAAQTSITELIAGSFHPGFGKLSEETSVAAPKIHHAFRAQPCCQGPRNDRMALHIIVQAGFKKPVSIEPFSEQT